MKKLIYLIMVIAVLALIVAGCTTSVVPPTEQGGTKGSFGTTIYVDDSNTTGPLWNGTQSDPFCTIQEALDDAADTGDTIIVAAGTYTNDIWDGSSYRITKSVTLLGAQAGVDPQGNTDRGDESILVRTNGLPYSLFVSGITIDGFMNGNDTANSGGRFIIAPDADDVTIKNCIIQNTPTASSGHGVYIYPGAQNALIEYNTFYNTGWEAIASWQVSGAVISHNYISSSGQHAIQMMGHLGSNNEISYNHISGIVGKNAIQYWGGPGAIITHNVIDGGNTMFDGIWLDTAADGSTVSNNQIFDTIYAGINIRGGCTDAVITCNDISYCGTGVDVVGTITGTTINFNNIYENGMGVANYYSTDIIDALYNWWGHATGPHHADTNPDGQGNEVSDNVDYDPWSFTPDPCEAKTLGFWKNHEDSVTAIFNEYPDLIILGEYPVLDAQAALEILKNAKANNAYNMLAAQLLTAKLNKLHLVHLGFVAGCFDDPIDNADAFLIDKVYIGPDMDKPNKVDKATAIGLKDALDWVNINGCDECVCEWD